MIPGKEALGMDAGWSQLYGTQHLSLVDVG
jgi:hypothetical protein